MTQIHRYHSTLVVRQYKLDLIARQLGEIGEIGIPKDIVGIIVDFVYDMLCCTDVQRVITRLPMSKRLLPVCMNRIYTGVIKEDISFVQILLHKLHRIDPVHPHIRWLHIFITRQPSSDHTDQLTELTLHYTNIVNK